MTAATTTQGVDGWLLALVSAAPDELLSLGVAACAAGLSQTLIECLRCPGTPVMKFPAAVRHLLNTEAPYVVALGDPAVTAMHGPGDLIPAPPRPPRPPRSGKTRRWRQR